MQWTMDDCRLFKSILISSAGQGLMPLLMKQRDGYRWTETDRREIRMHLRNLASLSPYLVLFISPGGFIALPVLVWWLDRRRRKWDGESADPDSEIES